MRWINVKRKLPCDGQEVFYFSPYLGLWRGKYKHSPTTHSVDAEGNKRPISEELAALISPHVFIGGGGCCDTDEVTHWQPYNDAVKQNMEKGWMPLPPNYGEPDMADLRDFHDKDEDLSVEEYDAAEAAQESNTGAWLEGPDELIVDPAEGWRYGFPKVWNKKQDPDIHAWLLKEGYPQRLIDKQMPMRFMEVSK
jgi:hypothetical protein